MTKYYDHDSEVSIYDQPGLQYDSISGLAINGTTTSSFFVPMILTTYSPPTYKTTINEVSVLAIPQPGGLTTGGNFASASGQQFPKISMEGVIDIATVSVTETAPYAGAAAQVSAITVNSIPMHWIEILAMFFEGRYAGGRYDPTYFRDSYGRIYNSPRIFDLTASYIPGTPTRANFSMTLMLRNSYL